METKVTDKVSTTNDPEPGVVPQASKQPNRRGKASKGRQAEKFRLKKNEEERARTKEYISEYTEEELLFQE